jgi:predicted nucleic acid-binding protein
VILVDTSVWVDHLRRGEPALVALLERGDVLVHPFVVGELACGNLSNRTELLELLQQLPASTVAEHAEVMGFIEARRLYGRGIGYVDAHLLASAAMDQAPLWTRDQRLRDAASGLSLAASD